MWIANIARRKLALQSLKGRRRAFNYVKTKLNAHEKQILEIARIEQ
jgi:hypothetical protein